MRRLVLFAALAWMVAGRAAERPCADDLADIGGALHEESSRLAEEIAAGAERLPKTNNVFLDAGFDWEAVAQIHRRLGRAYPPYTRLRELFQKQELSSEEWEEARRLGHQLKADLARPHLSPDEIAAFEEIATIFPSIEARRPFTRVEGRHIEQTEAPEEKEEGEGEPSASNPWNKPSGEYSPHNKRLGNRGKSKGVELLRTDAISGTYFFRQVYYDAIAPNRVRANAIAREIPRLDSRESEWKTLELSPHGMTEVALPLPNGYAIAPRQPSGTRIRLDPEGVINVSAPSGARRVNVLLAPIIGYTSPPKLEVYRQPSGIDPKAWPEYVLDQMRLIQSSPISNPLRIAKEIDHYLKVTGGFKYYSEGADIRAADLDRADDRMKEVSGAQAVKMAYAKFCNCDGASMMAVAWLRDFFNVPARLVAGRTLSGQLTEDRKLYDVVTSATPPHMWYEVWDGARWVPFDSQPPFTPKESSSGKQSTRLSAKKPQEQVRPESPASGEKAQKPADEKSPAPQPEQTHAGELLIDLSAAHNPFYTLLERVLQTGHAENTLTSGYATANSQLHAMLDALEDPFYGATYRNRLGEFADSWHSRANGHLDPIERRLAGLRALELERQPEAIWNEGKEIESALLGLGKLRKLRPAEQDLLGRVQRLLGTLHGSLNSPQAEQITRAENLLSRLPGDISRTLLEEILKHPLNGRGSEGFSLLAQKADTPELLYFRQLAAAAPLAKLILNRSEELVYKNVPKDERSPVPTRRNDVVSAKRPDEFPRFIWDLRPGEDLWTKFVRGEQFMVGSRETRRVVDPKHPLERKWTNVMVDVSGSMQGTHAAAVQVLLGDLIDYALSERDAMGIPLHTVLLTFFNDKVLTEQSVPIDTPDKAVRHLAALRQTPQGTAEGGTDLEAAVSAFYDYVARHTRHRDDNVNARPEERRRLKRANLIIISDGGAPFDLNKLRAKRDALPSDVSLFLNFLAVGGENPALKALAEESNKANASGMYHYFSYKTLEQILKPEIEIRTTAFVAKNDVIGAPESRLIAELTSQHPSFVEQPSPPARLPPSSSNTSEQEQSNRTLLEFHKFASWLITQKKIPHAARTRFWNQLVAHYPLIAHKNLESLSRFERQIFLSVQKWSNE